MPGRTVIAFDANILFSSREPRIGWGDEAHFGALVLPYSGYLLASVARCAHFVIHRHGATIAMRIKLLVCRTVMSIAREYFRYSNIAFYERRAGAGDILFKALR
jgi:hypothetical protein